MIGDLVVRRKGGRPAKDKKAARVVELEKIMPWPDIPKQIFKEFGENHSAKVLQGLRRDYLQRLASAG